MRKIFDFCNSASSLGLSSSSTVQDIYDALNPSVQAFCAELGLLVIDSGLAEYSPWWNIGYEGGADPLFNIITVNTSSSCYDALVISPMFFSQDNSAYYGVGGTNSSDSNQYKYLYFWNYPVKVVYETFPDGTIAFNFFTTDVSIVQSKFIIYKCIVRDKDYKVLVGCYSNGFVVSSIVELGMGINALHTVAYSNSIVAQNYVLCKRYGEIILNVPLNMGYGIYLPTIFKMYTNTFGREIGQLLNFKGRRYEIFNKINGTMLVDITEES